MERLIAFFFILLSLPLLFVVLLSVKLTSRGTCLHCSVRLGINRKPIYIWKIRTMAMNLPPEVVASVFQHQDWICRRKLIADPRLTSVGKFLRRFSLDEIPQLWNVLNGSMSLIGPRPIVHEEDKFYGKYSRLIHSVKPGMTGLWQVSGRNLLSYQRRIAINVYYVKNKSWKLDLWILYKTIGAIIYGRGAF